jgi:Mg2+/citrate symporter
MHLKKKKVCDLQAQGVTKKQNFIIDASLFFFTIIIFSIFIEMCLFDRLSIHLK